MKIIIAQKHSHVLEAIKALFTGLNEYSEIMFTQSFGDALDAVPEEGAYLLITGARFDHSTGNKIASFARHKNSNGSLILLTTCLEDAQPGLFDQIISKEKFGWEEQVKELVLNCFG